MRPRRAGAKATSSAANIAAPASLLRDAVFATARALDRQAVIATELPLSYVHDAQCGAIADVVVFGDRITIWEIKGDGDTTRRLAGQVPVYRAHADVVNVVAAPKLCAAAQKHIPDGVGLYTVDEAGALVEVQAPSAASPDVASLAQILKRDDLFEVAKTHFGLIRKSWKKERAPRASAAEAQLALTADLASPSVREAPSAPSEPAETQSVPHVRLSYNPQKHELVQLFSVKYVAIYGEAAVLDRLRREHRRCAVNDELHRRKYPAAFPRTSPVLLPEEERPFDTGVQRFTFWFSDNSLAWSFYRAARDAGAFTDMLNAKYDTELDAQGRHRVTETRWFTRIRAPLELERELRELAATYDALPIGAAAPSITLDTLAAGVR